VQVLAIIPARGGSKGIPMKNIQKIAGKPLIAHTILAAKKSKQIDKIIVSTDNTRIAQIAKSYDVEVPFLRPTQLSNDESSTIDAIKHGLDFLFVNQSYVPDIILILQPTSPLRTTKMINKSIEMLKKSNASSILTVSKIKTHPYGSFWYNKKYLKPFKPYFNRYNQRQKYPPLYYPTGAIYTFWFKTLKKYDSIYGPRIKPLITEDEFNIDIDNMFDLFICEMKLLHWEKYKKGYSL